MRTRLVTALSLLALLPARAHAHAGAHGPHDLWRAWTLEPLVLLTIVVMIVAYALGARRRGARRRGVSRWRTACHWLGVTALFIALVSPVDALGELLFSGHMVQHILLTMVAAPLLVLGDGSLVMLRALPVPWRRRVGRALMHRSIRYPWMLLSAPLTAWILHTAALIVWHIPGPYELAVRNDAVHALEHASFFLTALVFWWVVAAPRPRARLGFGSAIFYLFTAATAAGVMGAAIALSSRPWYTVHDRWVAAFGMTTLDDQQLAGLIMWVPAGLIYLVAIAPMVLSTLGSRRSALGLGPSAPSSRLLPPRPRLSASATPLAVAEAEAASRGLSRRDFLAIGTAVLAWPTLQPVQEKTLIIGTRLGSGDAELAAGIAFGVREANQSAALFGWRVVRPEGDSPGVPAVMITGERPRAESREPRAESREPRAESVVLLTRCIPGRPQPNTLTIGDCRRGQTHDAAIVEWFGRLERFGAAQLNDRFRAAHRRDMSGDAWLGWFSVKLALEAAMRAKSVEPAALLAYLQRPDARFDGHKGVPLYFRDGVLVQPAYAVRLTAEGWVLDRELPPTEPGA
jgi:cytochrome c oxidase assembly factor CtaG